MLCLVFHIFILASRLTFGPVQGLSTVVLLRSPSFSNRGLKYSVLVVNLTLGKNRNTNNQIWTVREAITYMADVMFSQRWRMWSQTRGGGMSVESWDLAHLIADFFTSLIFSGFLLAKGFPKDESFFIRIPTKFKHWYIFFLWVLSLKHHKESLFDIRIVSAANVQISEKKTPIHCLCDSHTIHMLI